MQQSYEEACVRHAGGDVFDVDWAAVLAWCAGGVGGLQPRLVVGDRAVVHQRGYVRFVVVQVAVADGGGHLGPKEQCVSVVGACRQRVDPDGGTGLGEEVVDDREWPDGRVEPVPRVRRPPDQTRAAVDGDLVTVGGELDGVDVEPDAVLAEGG